MNENARFIGLFIPAWLYRTKGLTLAEKNFLADVYSLSASGEYYKTNKSIADLFGISVRGVIRMIENLERVGAITVKREKKEHRGALEKRTITLTAPVLMRFNGIAVDESATLEALRLDAPTVKKTGGECQNSTRPSAKMARDECQNVTRASAKLARDECQFGTQDIHIENNTLDTHSEIERESKREKTATGINAPNGAAPSGYIAGMDEAEKESEKNSTIFDEDEFTPIAAPMEYEEGAAPWECEDGSQFAPPSLTATPEKRARAKFVKPTEDDVKAYAAEIGKTIDSAAFIDFYEANGWKVGRNAMKDWKAAVRNWIRREVKDYGHSKQKNGTGVNRRNARGIDLNECQRQWESGYHWGDEFKNGFGV